MKALSWRVYFALAAIAAISFWLTYTFNQSGLIAEPIAISAAGAVLGIIVQIFRDDAAFKKKQFLQDKNNDFILSATSHMANVAFDKHAAFAEEYVAEIHLCIASLIQTGPNKYASELACKLLTIRLKYTIWETESESKTLDGFEQALRTIGAQVDGLRDSPDSAARTKKLEEVYDIFNKVLGFENAPKNLSDEIIWMVVIQKMRELLGISKLTKMRQNYINKAFERSQP
jgi:hypothetical protein